MADQKPCPYHSTAANGMRQFPSTHPCYLTVDDIDRMLAVAALDIRDELLDLRNGERRIIPPAKSNDQ